MQGMRERLYGDLLDPAQVDALDAVLERDGCRMSELADALRVDASTATRSVNRLEKAGLVERVAAAGDGRGVRVVATRTGLRLADELFERRKAMLFGVLEGFEAHDRASLATLHTGRPVSTHAALHESAHERVRSDGRSGACHGHGLHDSNRR
jgi:DNA-binding MarR family transcriptional regulator